jgi:hypothetical protein
MVPPLAITPSRTDHFGGPAFSYSRMSWIKPNFLWMMYRSGWGTKQGQERTLAVRLARSFFDSLLRAAVASSYREGAHESRGAWQAAVKTSAVRLQWDPDHDPSGRKLERRAIQLGLRGEALERYGRHEPLEIIDLSPFVAEQRRRPRRDEVETPLERVYVPRDRAAATAVGLDAPPDQIPVG